MKSIDKTILVPTDFSVVADYALQHAIRVSGVVGEPVALLHIVDSPDKVSAAKERIEAIAAAAEQKHGIRPSTIVKAGSIFTDIAETARALNCSLVIMGSHTVRGKDELTGTNTLRVITSSPVPFITIQEPPVNKRYDDIVFPVDFTLENKEKHTWISYFCNYYVSRFHLIKPLVTDPEQLAKVDLNMASAIRFLDERGAKYEVYTVPGKKQYAEEVLDAAVNIRADLIVIMTTKASANGEYTMQPQEQYIIGNARHIPIMSINPR